MIRALQQAFARKWLKTPPPTFEAAFAATLPACRKAVEVAARHHRRPDALAVQRQREALHRALAHGRARA